MTFKSTEKSGRTCCSTPASMCYWCAVSLLAWGLLALIGIYWRPLRASAGQTILLAAAIGCFVNWVKNRTYHCGITGPLFLVFAILLLLGDVGKIRGIDSFVWPLVLVGTGIAFLLERRYARRP